MDDLTRLRYWRARREYPGIGAVAALATARRPDAEPLDWDTTGRTALRLDGFTVLVTVEPDTDPLDWPLVTVDERLDYYRRHYARHEAWLRATREHAADEATRERVEVWCVIARAMLDGDELGVASLGGVDVEPGDPGHYVDDVAREVADEAAHEAGRAFAREYPRW